MEWLEWVATVLVALIAGGFSSIIAPWAKWGIEKRAGKINYRREQIKRWRDAAGGFQAAEDPLDFRNTVEYSEMRPFLKQKTRDYFETQTIFIHGSPLNSPALAAFLEDVADLEQKWELI